MARQCTVCASPDRPAIEIGLCHGLSTRVLADRFNLSRDAVGRHARAHLSPATAAAILVAAKPNAVDLDALTRSEGEGLLTHLIAQRGRLAQLAEHGAAEGQLAVSIAAERATLANLETTGRLLSRFTTRIEHSHSHLLISPEYLRLRQVLMDTLRRFPDAARAVAAELHRLDSDAAKAIEAKRPPVIEAKAIDGATP